MGEKMDLGDIVISWSVQDIIDDDLYKGQVRGPSIPPLLRLCDGQMAAADVPWSGGGGDGRGPRRVEGIWPAGGGGEKRSV